MAGYQFGFHFTELSFVQKKKKVWFQW
jgi:hypothetical protein